MSDSQNKLHIDTDWKSQAQAEKQRLAEEARKKQEAAVGDSPGPAKPQATGAARPQSAGAAGGRQLPPADFRTLVSTMVTQAMFAMGMIPDPQTGRRMASMDMARHHIDMLSVIEEKTKGNLTDEETKLLSSALYELRMQYVQLSQQVIAEQMGAEGQ